MDSARARWQSEIQFVWDIEVIKPLRSAGNRKGTKNPPEIDWLLEFVPKELRNLANPQKDIPRLAKNKEAVRRTEQAVQKVPTTHNLFMRDAREMSNVVSGSVHLVLTSPPYWTLKRYRDTQAQLGHVRDFEDFLHELDKVWKHCLRVLVPGGRLICVVGDVCLARRKNGGRHTVVP